jgi:hypothetical protein
MDKQSYSNLFININKNNLVITATNRLEKYLLHTYLQNQSKINNQVINTQPILSFKKWLTNLHYQALIHNFCIPTVLSDQESLYASK